MSILDPKFRYINSSSTDIRKTFARIRRQQAEEKRRAEEAEAETRRVVAPIRTRGTAT